MLIAYDHFTVLTQILQKALFSVYSWDFSLWTVVNVSLRGNY